MIRLRASAKLNLYLRVLGKRPDGYHEIETLFERIDLADELTFAPHPRECLLTCTDAALSCGEDNLVMRAARLLQEAGGVRTGARVHLVKRIPIAAGLGGGSSDAAATLQGLNELWNLQLAASRLTELAAHVGSDVPFFLGEAPFAVGRGRGERIDPVEPAARLAHVLVVPAERLSTKEIYSGVGGFDLTAPKPSISMLLHALCNGSLGELAQGLWNDLEPEAIRRCPVIGTIQTRLRDLGCCGSRLSGSGPSVFGLCHDLRHAQAVASELRTRPAPEAGQGPWRIEIIQTDRP